MTAQKDAHLPVRYDPRLIEEAVFIAMHGQPQARVFRRERNRLYEITDAEERERAFQELHHTWFVRLGLGDQIDRAINEQPLLTSSVGSYVVARAPAKKEEGAELFVNPEAELSEKERRTVRILIRPESFLDPVALLTFLRHELLHITDMLDPNFGYEPVLPVAEGGPGHSRLLQDRYRALWDATIDGRMVRHGWAPKSIRAERLADFCRTFSMLGEEAAQVFGRFFDQELHTHAELVAFTCEPRAAIGSSRVAPQPGSRCPLCHFPTYALSSGTGPDSA